MTDKLKYRGEIHVLSSDAIEVWELLSERFDSLTIQSVVKPDGTTCLRLFSKNGFNTTPSFFQTRRIPFNFKRTNGEFHYGRVTNKGGYRYGFGKPQNRGLLSWKNQQRNQAIYKTLKLIT